MKRWPVILALTAGVGLTAWVIGTIDFDAMLDSMARVGLGGFLLLLDQMFGQKQVGA